MKAMLFIKENVILFLLNLIEKVRLSGFALGIVTPLPVGRQVGDETREARLGFNSAADGS